MGRKFNIKRFFPKIRILGFFFLILFFSAVLYELNTSSNNSFINSEAVEAYQEGQSVLGVNSSTVYSLTTSFDENIYIPAPSEEEVSAAVVKYDEKIKRIEEEKKKAEEAGMANEEINVVAPQALKLTVMEILENLVQYTLDSGEARYQENIERIIYALILFYDAERLMRKDILECAQLIKARIGEAFFVQFDAQLDQILKQKYKIMYEQGAEAESFMSKKQKTETQEQQEYCV